MILAKRPDIERFLARPEVGIRAALIYGRDMGVVRDRAIALAAKVVKDPDDPFASFTEWSGEADDTAYRAL